jgi:hypothetical protein
MPTGRLFRRISCPAKFVIYVSRAFRGDGVNHAFSAKSSAVSKGGPLTVTMLQHFLNWCVGAPVWCRRSGKAMMQCKVGLRFYVIAGAGYGFGQPEETGRGEIRAGVIGAGAFGRCMPASMRRCRA